MRIHPTAILHPSLILPEDLEVGPYSVIDDNVHLRSGNKIGPFCHLYPYVYLEENISLSDGVILGNIPQDLKFRNEITSVKIGRGSVLREYVTVNRGTRESGSTVIGNDCLIMAYTHIAHDCKIGEGAIIANGVQMGGHVQIGSFAVVSGMTGIHQFVQIGPGAFIGGGLRVDKNILPFSKALGEPLRYAGLNEIGIQKFCLDSKIKFPEKPNSPETFAGELKKVYREIFKTGKESVLKNLGTNSEWATWLNPFLEESKRSLLVRVI